MKINPILDATLSKTPVIDDNMFDEIRDLFEDDLKDLVVAYFDDSDKRIASLQQALSHEDSKAGYDIAHTMKGASLNLGLSRLNLVCFEIEKSCRNQDIEQALNLMNLLIHEVNISNNELKKRLDI